MGFLIQDAWAAPAEQSALGLGEFLPLIVLFVVFYLFLIRPQMKRAKEHKQLVESLKKGDEVVTGGGMLGRVTDVGENFVMVELTKGVEVKVQRQAINALMPKGTLKTL